MRFSISKCVHLLITNKTKPSLYSYSFYGVPISTASRLPYLGVEIDTKLTLANQITDIVSKSWNVLGLIKQTIWPRKPEVKETAYNMLI